jgi:hypothetical protein
MRSVRPYVFTTVLAIIVVGLPTSLRAQDLRANPLDRVLPVPSVVSLGEQGVLSMTLIRSLERLSVPAGVEEAGATIEARVPVRRGTERDRGVNIGGLTVRAALDKIVAADPRYEWRFVDDVVVLRPVEAWKDTQHPLLRNVPAVELVDVRAWEAIDAVREAVGHISVSDQSFQGERVFSVTFGGGALIDLLDAVVAAHGEMGWALQSAGSYTAPATSYVVRPALFVYAPSGHMGELENALLESETAIPGVVRKQGYVQAQTPRGLDVPLPPYSLVWRVRDLLRLAESVGVPFGFEEVGALVESVSKPFRRARDEIVSRNVNQESIGSVDGRTLRQVLDAVVAADPRYEWRDMDGVAVMRPVSSWARADHPFESAAAPVSLRDARVSQGLDVLMSAVRHTPSAYPTYGDESRFSVEFPGGTLLELANAIVRGHGGLSWSITSHDGRQQIDDSTAVATVEPFVGLGSVSFPLFGERAGANRAGVAGR